MKVRGGEPGTKNQFNKGFIHSTLQFKRTIKSIYIFTQVRALRVYGPVPARSWLQEPLIPQISLSTSLAKL